MVKYIIAFIALVFVSCDQNKGPLPYLGHQVEVDGQTQNHKIRPFNFIKTDSSIVTNQTFAPYVYVADFFFTSCPSICPKVMKEMLKIYDEFKDNPQVKLVSFTLDPVRDTPQRLNTYASNLEVDQSKWFFLSGELETTMDLTTDYFVTAMVDEEAPGGFNHSGQIILVDKNGHVRSFSDGTDASTTDGLISDIYTLLDEYK